jgi:prenyltransferase beta subunit
MIRSSAAPAALAATLALAVAAPAGARAVSAAAAARRAAAYLVRAQNPDGGLGGRPGEGSAPLFSGWAALGLAAAGRDPARLRDDGAGPTLLAYVARGAGARDAGSIERTILVAVASGTSARRVGGHPLVRELEDDFARDGSVSGQVNLTAFGVLALQGAGADPRLQARARTWLAGQRDRDGGFNYAGRGGTSDPDDTGAVLEALGRTRGARITRSRRGAVAYLARAQRHGGGFASAPGEGSNTQSTAWAVQGLLAARAGGRVRARALRYLRSMQKPDGAIRYSAGSTQTPVWVTAEALMALEGAPLPVRADGASVSDITAAVQSL